MYIANSFFQRIIALTSHVCLCVIKRDILVLFQTLSTVSHATSPSPQFFSNLELAQITLVLFSLIFMIMGRHHCCHPFKATGNAVALSDSSGSVTKHCQVIDWGHVLLLML